MILLLENTDNIAKDLLLAEAIEDAEMLLINHCHVVFFFCSCISVQAHLFVDRYQLFELEATSIALYGLELGVVQHLLYECMDI